MEPFDLIWELMQLRAIGTIANVQAYGWYRQKIKEIKEDFNDLDFDVWNDLQYLKDKYTNELR